MAAVAMETAKMQKEKKTKNDQAGIPTKLHEV
jgi:hypothetical protein